MHTHIAFGIDRERCPVEHINRWIAARLDSGSERDLLAAGHGQGSSFIVARETWESWGIANPRGSRNAADFRLLAPALAEKLRKQLA